MQQKRRWIWCSVATALTVFFLVFTLTVKFVDVQKDGTQSIGWATVNFWWRDVVGVQSVWHVISHIVLGASFVALGVILFWQIIHFCRVRKLRLLPRHWWYFYLTLVVLAGCYALFEFLPLNYRPFLVNGIAEVSYPSSHVLMLTTLCPLLVLVFARSTTNKIWVRLATVVGVVCWVLGVVARLLSGYHWFTDIVGGGLLGATLVAWYCTLAA